MFNLDKFCREYRKPNGGKPRPRTLRNYERYLEYLNDWWEDELDDLTADDLNAFAEYREWGANTVYLALAAVHAYLRTYHPEHPLMEHSVSREESPPGRSYGEAVMLRMLDAIDRRTTKGKRDFAMLSLILEAGYRAFEIQEMEVDGLDLEQLQLTAVRKRGHYHTADISKSADALKKWLQVRSNGHKKIFHNMKLGSPLSRSGVAKIVRDRGEAIGIKVSPHDLRRSGAANLVREGVPHELVMRQFDWKSYATFQRYVLSLVPSDIRKFNGWLDGGER